MIARLYAMYQQSRNVLMFLLIIFLAVNIADGVLTGIIMKDVSGEAFILSGVYQCTVSFGGDSSLMGSRDCMGGRHTMFHSLDRCQTLP
ncbi:hypothetical protein BDR07DRAFT_1406659 [Suillus spraguei]|nr:hypothetical protein BDR07DRAFT_1425073 [Suillus spraguei]KAG2362572.1 hypothetical protein BDR07DRAFT_1406659 [Suillus spraguei]